MQKEIKKRTKSGQRYSGVGIFGSKIICGDCGNFYGAKVWHSTDKENIIINTDKKVIVTKDGRKIEI